MGLPVMEFDVFDTPTNMKLNGLICLSVGLPLFTPSNRFKTWVDVTDILHMAYTPRCTCSGSFLQRLSTYQDPDIGQFKALLDQDKDQDCLVQETVPVKDQDPVQSHSHPEFFTRASSEKQTNQIHQTRTCV